MIEQNGQRRISFPVAEKDVLDAQYAHFRASVTSPGAYWGYAIVGVFVFGLGLGSFFWTLWSASENNADFTAQLYKALGGESFRNLILILVLIWVGFLGAVTALSLLVLPRRVKRIYAQQKSLQLNYEVAWDDAAMDVTTSQGTLHYPWTDFVRWNENATTLLVYQSDMMFNFIPKHTLNGDNLDDFRAKLSAAKVPKSAVR